MTALAQPNYLLLTEACASLRETLRPYVEQQLRNAGPGWWKDYLLPNVSPLSRDKLPQQPVRGERSLLAPLDLADLLQLINRNWANVFRGKLPDGARAYAQELYDTRNLWAHKGEGDISRAAAERAIDTAALLLDGVERKAAAAMRALKTRGAAFAEPRAATKEPVVAAHTGGLRSWREVAIPRGDVRSGALSQGQFAADLA